MRPKPAGAVVQRDAIRVFDMNGVVAAQAKGLAELHPDIYVALSTFETEEEQAAFNPKVQPDKQRYTSLCPCPRAKCTLLYF